MTDGNGVAKKNDDAKEEIVEKNLEEAGVIKPPDGGYGWFVVLASFLANMVVDGVIFTVGQTLLPAWKEYFQVEDTAVSIAMSVLGGSYLLAGPVTSALVTLFGCRAVVIGGSLLAAFGFTVSTLAPSVSFLYIFFGLVGGVGFGFIYLPAIVIISQYFDERRALATGLAVCGSGIGTTVFGLLNPVVMKLVNSDWRFFCVYLAIISLFAILCGLVFKAPEPSKEQVEKVAKIAENYENEKNETGRPRLDSYGKLSADRPFLSSLELNAKKQNNKDMWSQHDLVEAVARESIKDLNRPISQTAFYPGSTTSLNKRTGGSSGNVSHKSGENGKTSLHGSVKLIEKDDAPAIPPVGFKENLITTFKNMLDPELLTSPSFIILAISGFLTLSCFYVPFNYIGEVITKVVGKDHPNLTSYKSMPLTIIGVVNICARIVCGWLSDRPEVDALLVNNIALILAGICTCLLPMFSEYWHFIVFCFPFATGIACFAALRSVICVELFGLKKLSNAFGILLTFMGVGALIGSPIAAFIKDMTGDFTASFYIMGTLMALSGAIMLPLKPLRAWELKRKSRDAKHETELERLQQA